MGTTAYSHMPPGVSHSSRISRRVGCKPSTLIFRPAQTLDLHFRDGFMVAKVGIRGRLRRLPHQLSAANIIEDVREQAAP